MYKAMIFSLLALSLSAQQAQALDTTRAAERQELREERQELRQELRSSVAELHAIRLERRFGFYYTRLTNIITRFEARLALLVEDGQDVSAVQAKLDGAKAKLEAAKIEGAEAIAAFKAIDPARFSEQRDEAFAARDLAKEARKLFQEAHSLLKEAIRLLKTL